MKRLLVTASTFPRFEGDSEPRFVLDLCKALTEYFDVTVLVPAAKGAKDTEDMEGVHVIRYHYFPIHKLETLCYPGAIFARIRQKKSRALLVPFLFLSLFWHIRKLEKNYDVMHSHWLIPQGIVHSFCKKPYLLTGHGGDVTSLNKGILRKLKARALKKAAHVTCVSNALLTQAESIYPFPNSSVISMGCNTDAFGLSYRKEDYFHADGKKVILFVGRLVEIKGVHYLIEAMKKIDAKLVIVGDGPMKQELANQVQINDLHEKVTFLGSKNHEELRTIYASADIFAAPSITTSDGAKEGFGLVILEAMASSLPVIASSCGGIVDLVQDGYNGFLAEEKNADDLADKINRLLSDATLYQTLAEHAKSSVGNYDYKKIAARYAEILNKIS